MFKKSVSHHFPSALCLLVFVFIPMGCGGPNDLSSQSLCEMTTLCEPEPPPAELIHLLLDPDTVG